jgi:hypothetical protein
MQEQLQRNKTSCLRGELFLCLILLCQIIRKSVIPAGKRVSSAMDGKLKSIHGAWIPAIPAGMTILGIVCLLNLTK